MNDHLSFDAKNMDKQCFTSTGQSSEVCDNSKEIPERCSLEGSNSDYMCNLCNKSFAKEQYLNNHIKIHVANKLHSCQICSKSFKLKGDLKRHLFTHYEEKPHICKICNKSFAQKVLLKGHLLLHSGEKPHVCKICNKSFTLKQNLKKHLLLHSGENPHVCKNCNKSYTRKDHLKRHLLTHTGEKQHLCNMCSMSFRYKDCLKKHSLTHSRKRDMKNSSVDRAEELASTSEKSKNVNSDSHLDEIWENSQENYHPGKLQVKEETVYIIKEEHDIGYEVNKDLDVDETQMKTNFDLHEMSCNVKEENMMK